MQYRVISAEKRTGGGRCPSVSDNRMPAQETVRASFFCAGTAARGGSCLRGGLFMGWSVCGTVCGIVYGTDSLRLRNLFKDEVRAGTGEPDRESGNRGRKSGRLVVNGRIGRPVGGRFAGRMFPGRGEWPFLRSPKYLRRISCTVRNNPVYLQVRTEEANR